MQQGSFFQGFLAAMPISLAMWYGLIWSMQQWAAG